jgi:DNA-directed RNA polymerase specialized sigma24 family protein
VASHSGAEGRAARERECPAGSLSGDGGGEGELAQPRGVLRDPLRHVMDGEARERVWLDLQALTARERRLVGLQALGLSYAEIATVERQVLRGRRRLRGQSAS